MKKAEHRISVPFDRTVRNWKTVPLGDLVSACRSVHGAKYLLLQRKEVVDAAKAKGLRPGTVADRMIAGSARDERSSRSIKTDVRLWCPDCDRETPHDVSGAPVAECRDCMEPHEMTAEELIKVNAIGLLRKARRGTPK